MVKSFTYFNDVQLLMPKPHKNEITCYMVYFFGFQLCIIYLNSYLQNMNYV